MLSPLPRVLAQSTAKLAFVTPAFGVVTLRYFFASAILRTEKDKPLKTPNLANSTEPNEEQLGKKIKKPVSTFFRFVRDQRSEIVKQNPGLSFGETSRLLSQTWKDLPYAQRQAYQAQYDEDLAKYEAEKAKIAKEAPPKRPAGPFIIFYRELREELMRENPSANIVVMSKAAASKWKMLDAETKEGYRRRYQQEKKEWEARYGQFIEQKKLEQN